MFENSDFKKKFYENIDILVEIDQYTERKGFLRIKKDEFEKTKNKRNALLKLINNFSIERNEAIVSAIEEVRAINKGNESFALALVTKEDHAKFSEIFSKNIEKLLKKYSSWECFCQLFLTSQQSYSFFWTLHEPKKSDKLSDSEKLDRQYLELDRIGIDSAIKTDLGQIFLQDFYFYLLENDNLGDLNDALDEFLFKELYEKYENNINKDFIYYNLNIIKSKLYRNIRQSFSDIENHNIEIDDFKKIIFVGNSSKFSVRKEYSFNGSETALGCALEERLKKLLGFDYLNHTQTNRDNGKFENKDLLGIKINEHIDGDSFDIYSFELKITNSIADVYLAFSQALNYRSRSNFTYIIIPKLESSFFPSIERYNQFIDILKENNIGAISIVMDKDDNVNELNIVLPAHRRALHNDEWLMKVIHDKNNGFNFKKCRLCNCIFDETKPEAEIRCGWKVKNGDEKICMRVRQEKCLTDGIGLSETEQKIRS